MNTIKVEQIKVETRYREEKEINQEFLDSIKKFGIICPIILSRDNQLVDGERRYLGCKKLGLTEIPFVFRDELDELTRKEIEVETNVRRKAFTDGELSKAILDLHRLKQKVHGTRDKGRQDRDTEGKLPGWTLQDTAKSLNMSVGQVNTHTQVATYLERRADPEVQKALDKGSVWDAYKLMRLKQEREVRAMLSKKIEEEATVDEAEIIRQVDSFFINCDCLDGIRSLPDGSIDLVYTDPPYGINIDKVKKDSKDDIYKNDTTSALLNIWHVLPAELYRVLKKDSFAVVWIGWTHYQTVRELLEAAGFLIQSTPFVWVKVGTPCQCTHPEIWDASATDAAIICVKGEPVRVKQGQPNYICVPSLKPEEKKHPLERPTNLLTEHISRFISVGQSVLDPFMGSGSTAKACFKLNLKPIGFEIEENYYNETRLELIRLIQEMNQKKKGV